MAQGGGAEGAGAHQVGAGAAAAEAPRQFGPQVQAEERAAARLADGQRHDAGEVRGAGQPDLAGHVPAVLRLLAGHRRPGALVDGDRLPGEGPEVEALRVDAVDPQVDPPHGPSFHRQPLRPEALGDPPGRPPDQERLRLAAVEPEGGRGEAGERAAAPAAQLLVLDGEAVGPVPVGLEAQQEPAAGHVVAQAAHRRLEAHQALQGLQGNRLELLGEVEEERGRIGAAVQGLLLAVHRPRGGDRQAHGAGPEGQQAELRAGLEGVGGHRVAHRRVEGEPQGEDGLLAVGDGALQRHLVGGPFRGAGAFQLSHRQVRRGDGPGPRGGEAGQVAHLDAHQPGQHLRVQQRREAQQEGADRLQPRGPGRGLERDGGHQQGHQLHRAVGGLHAVVAQRRPGHGRQELEGAAVQPAVLPGQGGQDAQVRAGAVRRAAPPGPDRPVVEDGDRVVAAQEALGHDAGLRPGGRGAAGAGPPPALWAPMAAAPARSRQEASRRRTTLEGRAEAAEADVTIMAAVLDRPGRSG